jgi:hypothetical protein
MSAPPDPAKLIGGQPSVAPRVHPVTDVEVATAIANDPGSVHQSWHPSWHEQVWLLDHGQGPAPKAFRTNGGKILIAPDYHGAELSPRSGDTMTGMGVSTGRPATPAPVGGSPGPAPSAAATPRPAGSKMAKLPEWAGREPIMGTIVHIIDNPADAAALYTRLQNEGQRNTMGTRDPDYERAEWQAAGGTGEPPMAWIRASDGVVRFNFSAFEAPNLGGYTNEPMGQVPRPGGGR